MTAFINTLFNLWPDGDRRIVFLMGGTDAF
jgi:hypothetical protein